MSLSREILAGAAAHADPSTLCSLSRCSKQLYALAMPLLYSRPCLDDSDRWSTFERTWASWLNPWVRKAVAQGKIEVWKVKQLTLRLPLDERPFAPYLPDLSFLASANILSALTSLAIRGSPVPENLLAALLAPRRPARSTLKTLELDFLPSPSPKPPVVLAFILQALDFLPRNFYLEEDGYDDEREERSSARKTSWDELDRLVEAAEKRDEWAAWERQVEEYIRTTGCTTRQYYEQLDLFEEGQEPSDTAFPLPPFDEDAVSTSSCHSSMTDTTYLDSEDALSDYSVHDPDRWVCHSPEKLDMDTRGEMQFHATRNHGRETAAHLQRLSTTISTSEAFSLFTRIFRPPGRRVCDACVNLPAAILASPRSSSPFSNLTYLAWTLSFGESRNEDLWILLGTDVASGLQELKLLGTLVKATRELDLLIRSSVALSSPPGLLIPPTPVLLAEPTAPAQLSLFSTPSATSVSANPDAAASPGEREKVEEQHAFRPSWLAHLTAAARSGEELVKQYRGPRLAKLDASEVKMG
ncbi:hypothetical protein JCM10213_005211 [Rhodosporidiobolus nylandii]